MSNVFTGKSATTGRDASAGAGELATAEIGAALKAIADHLFDLDRRQTDAMGAMQSRLSDLCDRTYALRSEIPDEFVAAFDRIQDGVHLLAERLATRTQNASDAREHHREPSAATPRHSIETPIAHPMPELASEPLALRSAMQARATEINSLAASPKTPIIDPFDFKDEDVTPVDQQLWDRVSADALTKAYEAADPIFVHRAPAQDAKAAVRPASADSWAHDGAAAPASQQASGPAMFASAAASPAANADRSWLEARFADIAARIEQSIAEVRPDHAVTAIGERFDLLEERLGSALQEVATRADVEGLRLVEAHINELAAQIEQAQTQLSRLEIIEAQLNQLTDDLSSRVGGGVAELSPESLELIARSVADETAHRVVSQMPAAPVAIPGLDQIANLQHMLQSYSDERRQGEQHQAAVLDTVQQALVQLLDRVDGIEQNQLARVEPQQQARAAVPEAVPPLHMTPRMSAGDVPAAPVPQLRDSGTARAAAAAAAAAASRVKTQDTRWSDVRATRGEPVDEQPKLGRGGEETAVPRARREQAVRPPEGASDGRRDDFLLAARRQMQGPAVPDKKPDPLGEKTVSGLNGMLARLTKRGDAGVNPAAADKAIIAAVKPGASATSSKPYLLVAIIAMLIAGGLFLTVRPMSGALDKGDRKLSTQKMNGAETMPPAAKSTPKKLPDAESLPENAAPTPGQDVEKTAPPAAPDKTGMDTGQRRPGTSSSAQPVTGAEPASFGIAVDERKQAAAVDEIIRARRQQDTAQMSERAGRVAAQMHSASAVAPEARAPNDIAPLGAPIGADGAAGKPSEPKTITEMPPMQIGPASLRTAAANGDPSAEFDVAARFAQGKGVKQDFDQAAKWYQRAATRGFAPAQYRLGTLFERGLGVKADLARARIWYLRAAEQGNVRAMHNLAVLSAGRQASAPDYTTASHWFTEAASHGLADSQFNLAVLYENGLGVPKDQIEALKWYTLAGRGGDKEATRRIGELRPKLSAEMLETVDRNVVEWEGKPIDKMVNDAYAAGEAWKTRAAAQTR